MGAYYTPLRYPGGKGKIADYFKAVFEMNGLVDGCYAEPYAGGAGVALELLFQEYASRIYINDVSPAVGAFWRAVLNHTDELCAKIVDVRVTMAQWYRQRAIQRRGASEGDLALGFSTFFLNRTNRSGILDGGVIGGRDQSGPWKIDARYNVEELVRRIQAIARLRPRIVVSQADAFDFIAEMSATLPARSLVYLDPPYYLKGRELYLHHYVPEDHETLAALVPAVLTEQKWIVSYDSTPEVLELYTAFRNITYRLSYSAQNRYKGSEAMFFGPGLRIPELSFPMRRVA